MTATPNPRIRRRRATWVAVLLALVCALVAGVAAHHSAAGSAAIASDTPPGLPAGTDTESAPADGALAGPDGLVTEADGILPDGVTAFDETHPGVTRLQPDLLTALRRAATDAAAEGIVIHVNSGWRSAEYQDELLAQAVSQYGSEAEAARWVATATTSAHVAGEAVDIGSYDAVAWLAEHGAGYGLCQTYGNEPWHFELRPEAVGRGCPVAYADPTQDPRMRG